MLCKNSRARSTGWPARLPLKPIVRNSSGTKRRIDRRFYTFCVLERLQDNLGEA